MWHHEHIFREVDDGIIMEDIVSYALPLGFLGRIAHWFFVSKKVQEIFKYRSVILKDYFINTNSFLVKESSFLK
jgi:ligand-binding SRPBCC domain-containing protein